jgi:methyl-accepting chemotaxis protein
VIQSQNDRSDPNSPESAAMRSAAHEIRSVVETTEAAVLSLSGNLASIVEKADDFIKRMKERMSGLQDGAVGAVLQTQCETVDSFVRQLVSMTDEQASAADRITHTAKSVTKAAAAIDGIAFRARVLSLNSKIEAARLPKDSPAFNAIADEIRSLSAAVADTNARIRELSESLLPLLEHVGENVAAMRERAETFSGRMDDQRGEISKLTAMLQQTAADTLSSGDERLAEVLELSQGAMVDLQFQDLVSQKLRHSLRLLDPDGQADEPENLSARLGDSADSLDAGDVLLF